MAVATGDAAVPFWYSRDTEFQTRENDYKSAYQQAVSSYNLKKNQLASGAGVSISGDVASWGTNPGGVNFDIDASNPYGSYQQLRTRSGNIIQQMQDSYHGDSGSTGYDTEIQNRQRNQEQGELTDWRRQLMGNIFDITTGVQEAGSTLSGQLQGLSSERTYWDAVRQLNDPVVPNDSGAPGTPEEHAGQQATSNNAEAQIRLAYQKGDTATLAKYFKTLSLPDNLRKMADQFYNEWKRRREYAATQPQNTRPAPANVRPDPHPSSTVRPDPYRG